MKPTKLQQRARIAVAKLLQKNRDVALSRLIVFAHETSCPPSQWTELVTEATPDEDGYIMALADRPSDASQSKVVIAICGKRAIQHCNIDADTMAFDGEVMSMATRGFLYLLLNGSD